MIKGVLAFFPTKNHWFAALFPTNLGYSGAFFPKSSSICYVFMHCAREVDMQKMHMILRERLKMLNNGYLGVSLRIFSNE